MTRPGGRRVALRCAIILVVAGLMICGFRTDRVLAAAPPKTVAEIALYQGPDREKILVEGAKKEGQVTFYNSNTWMTGGVSKAFEKKYPFIKVMAWRSGSEELLKRVAEEYAAGNFLVDVVETSSAAIRIMQREGLFQEFYSPETRYYGDELKEKGKTGVYYLADRELYFSLGYNTKLVPPAEAPKSHMDFLNPKFKGKIAIAGTSTGVQWVGMVLEAFGRDYLDKMSQQEIKVQNISAAALITLMVAGEVPLSPTGGDTNILLEKKKGAPVDWKPIDPVLANLGFSGMMPKAPHPCASLLFLDYLHSKEGQDIVAQGELSSPREAKSFKKAYMDSKYSIGEYEKKYDEWEGLMNRLFVKRK